MTPNPGSPEALKMGCTCPTIDNNGGRGFGDPVKLMYWVSHDCPLHGKGGWRKEVLKARGIK